MKFLFFTIALLLFSQNTSFAMFEKNNKILLGRPKFKKPNVGSVYLGIGLGIPIYGLTNIAATNVDAQTNSAIQKNASSATANIPISIPTISATVGYLQISLPLRHELSFAFLNNNFSIPATLSVGNNSYVNPSVSMQIFFLQYYCYGYLHPQNWPVALFAGAGGGLAIFNTSLSDSANASSSLSGLGAGGTVGIATGVTYRIGDDIAVQAKLGYKVISGAFGATSSTQFPFIHVIDLNFDIFFKIL